MTFICGIDEAGRGPVIGPLVICGAIISDSDIEELKLLGVKDSKMLTPKKREELFEYLIKKCEYNIEIIFPKELNSEMKRDDSNLNLVEAKKSALIIKNLMKSHKVKDMKHVVLDCPSINISEYTKTMKKLIDIDNLNVICEHKADVNHIEVSCASIIAKVTRDRIIDSLCEKYGDFGSGYPSDPKTRAFLLMNCNDKKYKELFRTEWQTYKDMVNEKKQNKLEKFF